MSNFLNRTYSYSFLKNCVFVIYLLICTLIAIFDACAQNDTNTPYLMVLGVAQDAGYPQMGCGKVCCKAISAGKVEPKLVASLALIDPKTKEYWLFDATPDIAEQIRSVNTYLDLPVANMPKSIFLTHAHMGHYTGLMYFGREVMGAKKQKVYAMPRMRQFLQENGPWSQLVSLSNIELQALNEGDSVVLAKQISVRPLLVPHRDEFSETVGYLIISFGKKVLFIPDIDKWGKWNQDIVQWIKNVDLAYLDGTFYQDGEIPGKNMDEIPHPFITESIELFKNLSAKEKAKIRFIHLNHTNPLLREHTDAYQSFIKKGFGLAEQGEIMKL